MEETEKFRMIFISHATEDKEYIKAFVELLEALGLQEDEIICSSIPPYCIPLRGKVYEWLAEKFQNYQLHVIYMLSHNYYDSAASLNEMGAAWVMKQRWDAVLLPGFGFDEISGCIDRTQIGIKLDDKDTGTLKYRLGELREMLTEEFGLRNMSSAVWERKRDGFLNRIAEIKNRMETKDTDIDRSEVSDAPVTEAFGITLDAGVMLVYAAADPDGQIMLVVYLSGTSISAGNWDFTGDGSAREIARWTSAIDELVIRGYIKRVGIKDKIYQVTNQGYKVADQVKQKLAIDISHDPDEYL